MVIPRPPRFSGVDVVGWTIDIQQYFDYLETPETIRLLLVGILFDHSTYKWFHNYRSSNPDCSWREFLDAVYQKFDPSVIILNDILQKVSIWRDEYARKSARKSTEALKLPAELSTKSDEESDLSTKSDEEPPKELSTISDLESAEISTEISTLETLMVEPVVLDVCDGLVPNHAIPNIPDGGVIFPFSPTTATKSFQNRSHTKRSMKRSHIKRKISCQKETMMTIFPLCYFDFHLEDKVVFIRGGDDTDIFIYFKHEFS